jgi:peptidoglycan/xylan/chitin deacetylase (PgdA/CDA1 family)
MLLSTMYHHINSDRFTNDLDRFEQHLQYVIDRFDIVVPGDSLSRQRESLCLTFDDAYYDFYHYVFPLLKKYQIKVLLAVPTTYILEDTDLPPQKRLSLKHQEYYRGENPRDFAPFCTWKELREMHESGHVLMASHSHNHRDLTLPNIDLHEEAVTSKIILEREIGEKIESFVLPFGRYNRRSFELLQKHYRYIFKVGQGVNPDFRGIRGLIYRIDGDNMENDRSIFSFKSMLGYRIKSLAKTLHDGILER